MFRLNLDEYALITEVPDPVKLKVLFDELEFKTIASKILTGIDKSEKPRESQKQPVPEYGFTARTSFR